MKAITLRNIDEELDKALKKERKKTGRSINTIIIESLRQLFNLSDKKEIYNDLDDLAGTWSDKDLDEFEKNTKHFRKIDKELWQ